MHAQIVGLLNDSKKASLSADNTKKLIAMLKSYTEREGKQNVTIKDFLGEADIGSINEAAAGFERIYGIYEKELQEDINDRIAEANDEKKLAAAKRKQKQQELKKAEAEAGSKETAQDLHNKEVAELQGQIDAHKQQLDELKKLIAEQKAVYDEANENLKTLKADTGRASFAHLDGLIDDVFTAAKRLDEAEKQGLRYEEKKYPSGNGTYEVETDYYQKLEKECAEYLKTFIANSTDVKDYKYLKKRSLRDDGTPRLAIQNMLYTMFRDDKKLLLDGRAVQSGEMSPLLITEENVYNAFRDALIKDGYKDDKYASQTAENNELEQAKQQLAAAIDEHQKNKDASASKIAEMEQESSRLLGEIAQLEQRLVAIEQASNTRVSSTETGLAKPEISELTAGNVELTLSLVEGETDALKAQIEEAINPIEVRLAKKKKASEGDISSTSAQSKTNAEETNKQQAQLDEILKLYMEIYNIQKKINEAAVNTSLIDKKNLNKSGYADQKYIDELAKKWKETYNDSRSQETKKGELDYIQAVLAEYVKLSFSVDKTGNKLKKNHPHLWSLISTEVAKTTHAMKDLNTVQEKTVKLFELIEGVSGKQLTDEQKSALDAGIKDGTGALKIQELLNIQNAKAKSTSTTLPVTTPGKTELTLTLKEGETSKIKSIIEKEINPVEVKLARKKKKEKDVEVATPSGQTVSASAKKVEESASALAKWESDLNVVLALCKEIYQIKQKINTISIASGDMKGGHTSLASIKKLAAEWKSVFEDNRSASSKKEELQTLQDRIAEYARNAKDLNAVEAELSRKKYHNLWSLISTEVVKASRAMEYFNAVQQKTVSLLTGLDTLMGGKLTETQKLFVNNGLMDGTAEKYITDLTAKKKPKATVIEAAATSENPAVKPETPVVEKKIIQVELKPSAAELSASIDAISKDVRPIGVELKPSIEEIKSDINSIKDVNIEVGVVANKNAAKQGYNPTGNTHYLTDFQGNVVEAFRGISDAYSGLISNRYHGGTFFTKSINLAKEYALDGESMGKIEKVNLSMKNPFEFDANGSDWNELEYIGHKTDETSKKIFKLKEQIRSLSDEIENVESFDIVPEEHLKKLYSSLHLAERQLDDIYRDTSNPYGIYDTNRMVEYAKSIGHDGVIFKNIYDGTDEMTDIFVTLFEDQVHPLETIKLEFGNAIKDFEERFMSVADVMDFAKSKFSKISSDRFKENLGNLIEQFSDLLNFGDLKEIEEFKNKHTIFKGIDDNDFFLDVVGNKGSLGLAKVWYDTLYEQAYGVFEDIQARWNTKATSADSYNREKSGTSLSIDKMHSLGQDLDYQILKEVGLDADTLLVQLKEKYYNAIGTVSIFSEMYQDLIGTDIETANLAGVPAVVDALIDVLTYAKDLDDFVSFVGDEIGPANLTEDQWDVISESTEFVRDIEERFARGDVYDDVMSLAKKEEAEWLKTNQTAPSKEDTAQAVKTAVDVKLQADASELKTQIETDINPINVELKTDAEGLKEYIDSSIVIPVKYESNFKEIQREISKISGENPHYLTDPSGNLVEAYRGLNDSYGGLISNRYHGGTFFTKSLDLAKVYAGFDYEGQTGGKVEKVNLLMKNPFEFDADGSNWNDLEYFGHGVDEVSKEIIELKRNLWSLNSLLRDDDIDDDEKDYIRQQIDNSIERINDIYDDPDNPYGIYNTNEMVEYAKSIGHDGVIFKNIRDGSDEITDVFVTLFEDQVRPLETIQKVMPILQTYGDALKDFESEWGSIDDVLSYDKSFLSRDIDKQVTDRLRGMLEEYDNIRVSGNLDDMNSFMSSHPIFKKITNLIEDIHLDDALQVLSETYFDAAERFKEMQRQWDTYTVSEDAYKREQDGNVLSVDRLKGFGSEVYSKSWANDTYIDIDDIAGRWHEFISRFEDASASVKIFDDYYNNLVSSGLDYADTNNLSAVVNSFIDAIYALKQAAMSQSDVETSVRIGANGDISDLHKSKMSEVERFIAEQQNRLLASDIYNNLMTLAKREEAEWIKVNQPTPPADTSEKTSTPLSVDLDPNIEKLRTDLQNIAPPLTVSVEPVIDESFSEKLRTLQQNVSGGSATPVQVELTNTEPKEIEVKYVSNYAQIQTEIDSLSGRSATIIPVKYTSSYVLLQTEIASLNNMPPIIINVKYVSNYDDIQAEIANLRNTPPIEIPVKYVSNKEAIDKEIADLRSIQDIAINTNIEGASDSEEINSSLTGLIDTINAIAPAFGNATQHIVSDSNTQIQSIKSIASEVRALVVELNKVGVASAKDLDKFLESSNKAALVSTKLSAAQAKREEAEAQKRIANAKAEEQELKLAQAKAAAAEEAAKKATEQTAEAKQQEESDKKQEEDTEKKDNKKILTAKEKFNKAVKNTKIPGFAIDTGEIETTAIEKTSREIIEFDANVINAEGAMERLKFQIYDIDKAINKNGSFNKTWLKKYGFHAGQGDDVASLYNQFRDAQNEFKKYESNALKYNENFEPVPFDQTEYNRLEKEAADLADKLLAKVKETKMTEEARLEILESINYLKNKEYETFDFGDDGNASKADANRRLKLLASARAAVENANENNIVDNKSLFVDDKQIDNVKNKVLELKGVIKNQMNLLQSETFESEEAYQSLYNQLNENIKLLTKLNAADNNNGQVGKIGLNYGRALSSIDESKRKSDLKQYLQEEYRKILSFNFDSKANTADAKVVDNSGMIRKVTLALKEYKATASDVATQIQTTSKVEGQYYSLGAKWARNIATKVESLTQYLTGLELIRKALYQAREGFNFVVELDSAMTTIYETMDITREGLEDLSTQAIKTAQALGATSNQMIDSVNIYAAYGKTVDEIISQATPTVMLANAMQGDAETASEAIQGVVQQYKELEGQETRIVNTFEKLGSQVQIDFPKAVQSIAEGVQTAGSVMREAGVDFELYGASLAKVSETTRLEGTQIANAMKTIASRISRSQSGDEDVTSEDRSKTAKAYSSVGINVYNDDGSYRGLANILDELSDKWDTLTDAQRNYIAEQSAGVRNINVFNTMLDTWKDARQLAVEAAEDSDYYLEVQEKHMESIQAKIDTVKSTLQEFWYDLLDSGAVNLFFELVNKLVEGLNLVLDGFQGVGKLFGGEIGEGVGGLAGALAMLFGAAKALDAFKNYGKTGEAGKGIGGFISSAKEDFDALKESASATWDIFKLGTQGDTFGTKGFLGGIKALVAGLGGVKTALLGLGVGAVVIGSLLALFDAVTDSTEETAEAVKALSKAYKHSQSELKSYKDTTDSIKEEFEELSKGVNKTTGENISLTTDEYARYQEITSQIAEMYPDLVKSYDAQGNAILNLKGNIEELNKAYDDYRLKVARENLYGEDLNSKNLDTYVENFKNLNNQRSVGTESWDKFWDWGNDEIGGGLTASEVVDALEEIQTMNYGQIIEWIRKNSTTGIGSWMRSSDNLGLNMNQAYDANGDVTGYMITAEQWAETARKIPALIAKTNAPIQEATQNLKNGLQDYLTTLELERTDFVDIDNTVFSQVSSLISLMTTDQIKAITKSGVELETYVEELVRKLNNHKGAQVSLENILGLGSDASIEDIKKVLEEDLRKVAEALGSEDLDQLKIQLGLDDESEFIDKYNDLVEGLVEHYDDVDDLQRKSTKNSKNTLKVAKRELVTRKQIEDYIKDQNINTYDGLALLQQCVDTTDSWAEAIKKFELHHIAADFTAIIDTLKSNLPVIEQNIENVDDAIGASNESLGLSEEQISNVVSAFEGLDGYDYDKLFESTASGVRLNANELAKLNKEYEETEKKKYADTLDKMQEEYEDLCEAIATTTDEQERNNAITKRNNLKEQIEQVQELSSRFNGLTSAYSKWQRATSTSNPNDMYDAITSGLDDIDELYKKDLTGIDDFKTYMQQFYYGDLDAYLEEAGLSYQKFYEQNAADIKKYFTEDATGSVNFLNALQEKGFASKDENGRWSIWGDVEEMAEAFGWATSTIDAQFKKLEAHEFKFEFNETEPLDRLKKAASEAYEALDDTFAQELNINLNADNLEYLDEQAAKLDKEIEEALANGDSELANELQTILDYIIAIKGEKLQPTVDTSSAEGIADLDRAVASLAGKTHIDLTIDWEGSSPQYYNEKLAELRGRLDELDRNSDGTISMSAPGAQEALEILIALQQKTWELNEKNNIALNVDTEQLSGEVQSATEDMIALQNAAIEYRRLVEQQVAGFPVDTTALENAKATFEDLAGKFDSTHLEATATLKKDGIDLASEDIDQVAAKLTEIEADETLVKFGVDPTLVDGYDPEVKRSTVIYEVDHARVDAYNPPNYTRTVTYTYETTGTPPTSTKAYTDPWVNVNGNANAHGNARPTLLQRGMAFAKGTWGAAKSGMSLVGELGQELVVRGNRFFTVGDNGAEMVKINKDDIIFNHLQTKQILENGYVTANGGRGKMANASGNAYASGSGSLSGSSGYWATSGDNPSINITPTNNKSQIGNDADEFEEIIDWIEVLIERIETKIDDLDTKASSAFENFAKRAGYLRDEYSLVTKEIQIQQAAYEKYMQRFNSINLSSEYKQKILDGTLQIEDITDEKLHERIQEAQEWADKANECKYALTDLNEQLAEIVKTNFDNIVSEFDHLLSKIEDTSEATSKALDIVEAKGNFASKSYFENLMAVEQENLSMLKQEYTALQDAFDEAMATGTIEEGSEAW